MSTNSPNNSESSIIPSELQDKYDSYSDQFSHQQIMEMLGLSTSKKETKPLIEANRIVTEIHSSTHVKNRLAGTALEAYDQAPEHEIAPRRPQLFNTQPQSPEEISMRQEIAQFMREYKESEKKFSDFVADNKERAERLGLIAEKNATPDQ